MKELQKKELSRLISMLNAFGCTHKIITDDGEEFGSLEVVMEQARKKRRSLAYPYGDIASYYKPLINMDCAIGDVQEVPFGKYTPEVLRSAMCSHLGKQWGKGSYTTMIGPTTVQIMRTSM